MKKLLLLINPVTARSALTPHLIDVIDCFEKGGYAVTTHVTQRKNDTQDTVKSIGEQFDTVVCAGGDGTLNEVVNGAAGSDFAEVGCIPAGTGNDFIRNFPEGRFDDLIAQIRGQSRLCDLIRYEGCGGGAELSGYCVNMVNIGFDSNVVDLTARMKRLPLMTGTVAYLSSVTALLAKKKGADLRIEFPKAEHEDAGFVYDGRLLLIAVANGCFCGGGLKGLPRASTDDGTFDVSLVKNVPRHVFIRLFPKYMKGKHLEEKRLADVIRYTHETELRISPNRGEMKLCIDGEITKAGPVRFTICPKAFRFIVPR